MQPPAIARSMNADFNNEEARGDAPRKIVTFEVDGRIFGVDVSTVREIKGWQPTTALPNSAGHVLGVINLRGTIIAVYDLRRRLGLSTEGVMTRSSVVIVVDLGNRLAGLLADGVSDIVDITASQLREVPHGTEDDPVVEALAVTTGKVIALLDAHAIVSEMRRH